MKVYATVKMIDNKGSEKTTEKKTEKKTIKNNLSKESQYFLFPIQQGQGNKSLVV